MINIHNLRKRKRRINDNSCKENKPNKKRTTNKSNKEFKESIRQKKIVRKSLPVHSSSDDEEIAPRQNNGEIGRTGSVIEIEKNYNEFDFYKEFFEGNECLSDEDIL